MRGGKAFLFLLVIALGIGGYTYFVEMKRDISDPSFKKEKIFPDVTSGKVEEIEVHSENGDVTKLKKTGDTWQIVAPATLDVDTPAVSAVASTLETIEAQKVLEENPASVKEYGLEPPRYYLLFRAAGETAMRRLNVGSKTSIGADMYARAEGQTRLVLISSFLEDMLNRTTFNLRDKNLLKFSTTGVDSIRLEVSGSPALAFNKKEGDWRLNAPIDAKADFGAVEGMIGRVSQSAMNAIVSDTPAPAQISPADLKKFGFDKPQLSITFGTGSSRATLVIGGKKDDATRYARDLSRPLVFAVENKLLEDLTRKVDDVRVKDVFELRSFTVLGLDVTRGGQTYTFAKDKPAAPNQSTAVEVWKQTKPAAKDIDQAKFTDFLTALTNLRADKFADKPIAGAEELVVVGRSGDPASPKEERVIFRRSGTTVQAIRPGDPGAAVLVTADFDKALAQFKELAGIK